jgi:hypothetical protein
MIINPNLEFITSNYKQTIDLIQKHVQKPRLERLLRLIETDYGQRYSLIPASTQKEFYGAFPGGLCYHNLNVMKWLNKFANLMAKDKYPLDTLITVAVLHEIGKLGDKDNEYYVSVESTWHRDRGIFYEINKNINFMRVNHRSLFIAQEYGIDLNQEEYLAIFLNGEQYSLDNESYQHKEPLLVKILRFADQYSIALEKENEVRFF